MSVRCFVDTNVFLCAIDARDLRKQGIARALIKKLMSSGSLVLSTQVLQEFFHAATTRIGFPQFDALAAIESFSSGDVVAFTVEMVRSAIEISILEQQPVWDSMIVAAASQRRCPILYSETLGHGRRVRGVEVKNPFL